MKEKIKTVLWFISKPKYIPQVFQVLKRSKNKSMEDTTGEATEWCKKQVVSQQEALQKLGFTSRLVLLSELFPKEIKKAKEIEGNCPVKMGGEGAISFLYQLVLQSNSKKILETGVAYGWSTLAILMAIKDREGAILVSNDMPYIKMNNDDYVGCIIPQEFKDKWKLQREADVVGIPKALKYLNNEIDLCHYDSDKSYTGRMWASPLLWQALKNGGLFVADDINDNLAFKHFCKKVNKKPVIIEHKGKYVGVLRK